MRRRSKGQVLRRLKILFLTEWYPHSRRPMAGLFVQEHARAVQHYADVSVLHCAGPDPSVRGLWALEQESEPGLTEGIPTYRVWRRPLPGPTAIPYSWSTIRACHRIMASGFRPDLIHAHVFYAGVPAVILGAIHRIPVVISEHWSAFPRKRLNSRAILLARFAFQRAKAVLPVSYALQEALESYHIKANYQVVPNVVDTSLFFPPAKDGRPNGDKRLLCVARMDPRHNKGHPVLFRALVQLQRQRTDWHLDLVGDGPAQTEYETMVHDLGLTGKVAFHGLKPKPEVAEFMRRADVFVLPSLWENLPCVLIEALASGLPIVSTETGGIPEIVDAESGILVPPGDANKLAVALDRMMSLLDEFDRQAIAKKATRYSSESVGSLIHAIYDECLHGGGVFWRGRKAGRLQ